MGTILGDIRRGLLGLRKHPLFGAVAVLSLGLGVGINSLAFSWMKAIVLRPLHGVEKADELTAIHGVLTKSQFRLTSVSYPDYKDFEANNQVFSGLAAFSMTPLSLTGERPERVWGAIVSSNYFSVLGVRAALGRMFAPEDDQVNATRTIVVLGDSLWRKRFGGDPRVIGSSIMLNGRSMTVIGIAPKEFTGTIVGLSFDLWIPLLMQPELMPEGSSSLTNRGHQWLQVVGRLKEGVSVKTAQSAMQSTTGQLAETYPDSNLGRSVRVYGLIDNPYGARNILSSALSVLTLVAGLILLTACANVATMLLARLSIRRKELAVRLAMGASRGRLVGQLLTENLGLGMVIALFGFVFVSFASKSLLLLVPEVGFPLGFDLDVDSRISVFTAGLALLTVILIGVAPAFQGSRSDVISALKEEAGSIAGGRGKHFVRKTLVIIQVALSFISLLSGALLIRSLQNAQSANPGFNTKDVALASVDLFPNGYDKTKGAAFYTQLIKKAESLPGVSSATVADKLPLRLFGDSSQSVDIEGYSARPGEVLNFEFDTVGPRYFETMQIPLVEGRDFSDYDQGNTEAVAIVNQTMAQQYWPSRSALGGRVRDRFGVWRRVIGIAHNIKHYNLTEQPRPYMYFPLSQNYKSEMTLIVRTKGAPSTALSSVQGVIRGLDPVLPIVGAKTLADHTEISLFTQRFGSILLGAFGLLALALAVIGIYGVMSYFASQRTREIGIRVALGAQRRDILLMVGKEGMNLVLLGVAIGTTGSLLMGRLLSSLLYGVSGTDFVSFAVVTLLLGSLALLACYIPASSAAKTDPLTALRCQ
jgi:macrolide transport system ATP-binding/permease protein